MSVRLNLLPHELQQAQARNRHIQVWSAVIVPVAAVLCALLIVDGVRRVQADDVRDRNDDLQEELEIRRSEVRSLTESVAEVSLHLQRSDALRAKRNWSGMLALIGKCMPQSCWLTSLATDPEVAPAGAAISISSKAGSAGQVAGAVTIEAPRRLKIAGFALDAAEPHLFVANLKQTEVFKVVRLEQSLLQQEFDPPRFRFELVCEW